MSEAPSRRINVMARFWRGELPLWVSYWLVGFVTAIALFVVELGLGRLISPDNDYVPSRVFVAVVLIWSLTVAVTIWQCVGVWRSALRYRETKAMAGRSGFWGAMAQIGVGFGILSFAGTLVTQAGPQLATVTKIAWLGDPDIPAYHLRLMRNDSEIEITGGFKYGLAEDFQRIAAAAPRLKVVHLNSVGGRIGEAAKLAAIIRERGLVTYTSRSCVSACVIAFIAGRQRWLGPTAKLGFHAGSFAGRDIGFAQKILTPLGATPSFIRRASSTPSKEMWYPTAAELLANKVVTGIATPFMFAMSGYGPDVSQQDMAREVERASPLFGILARRDPEFFGSLLAGYHDSYVRGDSEGTAETNLRARLLPYIRALIPHADDASLLSLAKLMRDEYSALEQRDPKLCFEYASGAGAADITPYLAPELRRRELELYVSVLKTADPSAHPAPTAAQLKPFQDALARQLFSRLPRDKVRLMFKRNLSAADYGAYCDDMIATMAATMALGDPGGPMIMRGIFLRMAGR